MRLGSVFALPKCIFCISAVFFFFFLSWNFWLFLWTVHGVHCLQTHKFHFSATFSLKMSPTVLFTHLKIILLQCFLVFSFQLYPNGSICLDWAETQRICVWRFFFFTRLWDLRLLFMHSSSKVWLFSLFLANQCTPYTVHGPTNFTFQQLFH